MLTALLPLLLVLMWLQRTQAECQRAQAEGRMATVKLQRQQREWQRQRDELHLRLKNGIEQLQAVLASASHEDAELQAM